MTDQTVAPALFTDLGSDLGWVNNAHARGRYITLPNTFFVYLAMASDFALVAAASFLLGSHAVAGAAEQPAAAFAALCAATIILFMFGKVKLYRVEVISSLRSTLSRLRVVAVVLAGLLAVAYFAVLGDPNIEAEPLPVIVIGAALAGFVAFRFLLARAFAVCVERNIVAHNVVIVGATDLAAQFIEKVGHDRFGVRVAGVFDENADRLAVQTVAGISVRGDVDALIAYNRKHPIDTVVLALPLNETEQLQPLVEKLSVQPLRIRMLPGPIALEMADEWCALPGEVPGVHLMTIADLPIDRLGWMLKAAFDRLIALFALVLFAPIMLGCALAIRLTSPGPVLFRQKRIGYRNAEFNVFKFRSMHVYACNTGKLTDRNDPRVFFCGQIMRKFSFDELPQLFNVLRGEMSLVGPRPHMPEARAAGKLYFDAVRAYASRHRVKPGITGWAQVNGWRGPTETIEQIENRVAHDLHYIDNWSFLLDVKILMKTALVGFFGKNAF